MSVPFWLSYGVLWTVVLIETILVFGLLLEVGRFRMRRPQSAARDGVDVRHPLPNVAVGLDHQRVPLAALLQPSKLNVVASVLNDCPYCPYVVDAIKQLVGERANVAATVLVVDETLGKFESVSGVVAGTIEPDVALRALLVRAYPFIHVVDAQGLVLAKGLVNAKSEVENVLRLAQAVSAEIESEEPKSGETGPVAVHA